MQDSIEVLRSAAAYRPTNLFQIEVEDIHSQPIFSFFSSILSTARHSTSFTASLLNSIKYNLINYFLADAIGNDHTSMTAPHPVCSVKLSMFGLG
jgi:hypothetical protein